MGAPAKTTSRDLASEVAFLTRALKAPTLRESVARLAGPGSSPPPSTPSWLTLA